MDIVEIIERSQGGRGFAELGQEFGLDERQTRAAVEQLAPAVMAGIRRNTGSADGVQNLVQALATGEHDRYLDVRDPEIVDDGNAILGHVFGSKDVSRGVANQAAGIAGLDSSLLKRMLPVIAAMVMGALMRKMGGGQQTAGGQDAGGLGGILGQILGGGAAGGASGGGLGDILGGMLGGGQGGTQSAGGAGGGLGDILGGMLGGGQGTPQSSSAGGIGDILNNIFGGNAAPEVREAATQRAQSAFGSALGGGTTSGDAADKLLASIDRAVGRR